MENRRIEILSDSTGETAEKVVRAVPAGTYFLRVTHAGAAQTQYVMKVLVGKPSKKDLRLLEGT